MLHIPPTVVIQLLENNRFTTLPRRAAQKVRNASSGNAMPGLGMHIHTASGDAHRSEPATS